MKIELVRVREWDGAVYGVLIIAGRPRFVTLEEAWRDNQRNVSCIPVGGYRCIEYASKKFGSTFIVTEVPGRDGILFHVGNTARDTEGCILVGSSFNPELGGGGGITNSGRAFYKFMKLLSGVKEFELEIV
jgi:hypothetical protein